MIDTSGAQELYDLLIGAAAANAHRSNPTNHRVLADPQDAAIISKTHAAAALPLVQAACTFATSINSNRQRPPR